MVSASLKTVVAPLILDCEAQFREAITGMTP
jgi:hypothetical protein